MKYITILGSTGSIGKQTLDILRLHLDTFKVFALTANQDYEQLFKQCLEFKPQFAVLLNDTYANILKSRIQEAHLKTKVLSGIEGLMQVSADNEVNIVVSAIVGSAGLKPTLSAIQAGKRILLANKESLVLSGRLFIDAVEKYNAELLPIDSEHNAIFQSLSDNLQKPFESIILTASGGPFREYSLNQFETITVEQACKHPNWSMGRKISVDSATMANKGLEMIEARWLFNASVEQIQVVIHPQSIIHSLVSYKDGSMLAQLSYPDMRVPIAHALGLPDRIESGVKPLNLFELNALTFQQPDFDRFPCLKLAYQVLQRDDYSSVIFNASNEIAVDSFLNGQIRFTQISQVIDYTLNHIQANSNCVQYLDELLALDHHTRIEAQKYIKTLSY